MSKRNRKKEISALDILEMIVVAGFIAFVVVMLLSGSSKNVPMSDISGSVQEMPGIKELIKQDDTKMEKSFGMIPSEYIYYKSDSIMNVQELFIAKASSDTEMAAVEDAVNTRLETQIDNFTGYGTDQIDQLNHAIIMNKDNYCFYAVGEHAEEWHAQFLKIIR